MKRNLPITTILPFAPVLLSDLRFQVSLLRLMYPKSGSFAEAGAQVAELERLLQPQHASLTVEPAN